MATNITQKDKTLNEIIDWAKSRCHEAGLSRFDVLGYSVYMPSEVPNQSEE